MNSVSSEHDNIFLFMKNPPIIVICQIDLKAFYCYIFLFLSIL